MLSLEAFLPRLNPKVPGCPEPTALQALLDAATEFSDTTRAIRVTTEPVRIKAGMAGYDMDLPKGTEPLMFVAAWAGKRRLAVPPEADRAPLAAYLEDGTRGDPQWLVPSAESDVRLWPTPQHDAELLTVRLAVRPTYNTSQVMDVLFTRWREAVVAGAAMRLAGTPGQAYSNPNVVLEGAAVWSAAVSRARVEAQRDGSSTAPSVRMRPFA